MIKRHPRWNLTNVCLYSNFLFFSPVNVSYPDQENVMLQTTKGNTKKETMLIGTPQNKKEVAAAMQTMIRTLITLAQTMKVLPGSNFILFDHVVETRFVTMDLTYHDHTPDEYEPPFFRKMQIDEAPTWTSSESNKFTVGSVNTKHHAMELKVRVKQEAFSDEAITDVEEIILTPAKKHSQHASQPKQQVVEFPKPVVLAPVQQPSAMQVSDAEDDNTQPDMELEMQRMEEFIRKNDNVSMHELGKHFAHLSVGQLAGMIERFLLINYLEYVKQVKNKLNDEVYANAVAYVESLASVQVRVLAAKMDISSERASQLLDRMKQDGLVHDSASSQKKIVIKKKNVTAETQQQMVAPPETQQQAPTPATINPLSRKRKIGELEETTSQDASLVDSKLSTVATPIEQKRRRIYRDPKTIQ